MMQKKQSKLPLAVFLLALMELWFIFMVGKWIGGWATLALLIGSGALGAWLIKTEGRKVWQQARQQMEAGQAPGHSLLEGLCVLAGGILLIAPGFLSDIVGLTMLLPFTRPLYRLYIYRWLERKVRNGQFSIYGGSNRR
ncbi:FxsA family protein [Cohnella luojiensis]|uniref:FxsA family protein n=2 Tax=Cohnella luojiensis TaxID=652876 RepID=A0A4Y8M0S6_9BACL|nr:FxsA family protein [Cohnella luojiensis]